MKSPFARRPPLLRPLLRQAMETWSLESPAFLLYGLFMLLAGLAVGQLPLVGLVLTLAVEGPLAGGLILATRSVLLQERPTREDFLGGFQSVRRAFGLATLALIVPLLGLSGWLLVSGAAPWLTARGWAAAIPLLAVPGVLLVLAASLFYAVAAQVLLLEGQDPLRSLGASTRLVRRRPLAVALLLLFLALLQVLLALPTLRSLLTQQEPGWVQWVPYLLGMGLLGPFQGILGTLLYFRLRDEGGSTLAEG
ncbi:MAG: hypothetical protein WC326_11100 [Candidatus Delongbacteria bacterium]